MTDSSPIPLATTSCRLTSPTAVKRRTGQGYSSYVALTCSESRTCAPSALRVSSFARTSNPFPTFIPTCSAPTTSSLPHGISAVIQRRVMRKRRNTHLSLSSFLIFLPITGICCDLFLIMFIQVLRLLLRLQITRSCSLFSAAYLRHKASVYCSALLCFVLLSIAAQLFWQRKRSIPTTFLPNGPTDVNLHSLFPRHLISALLFSILFDSSIKIFWQ